jgi:hypothetical protein
MPRPSTLSYALNKKTDKLLKVYRKKGTGMTLMIPIGAAAGMLWVYFLGNMDRYLSTWSSLFHDGTASSELLTPLEGLFFNALMHCGTDIMRSIRSISRKYWRYWNWIPVNTEAPAPARTNTAIGWSRRKGLICFKSA